ncbi:aminotransferase, class V [Rhodobacterales bacterium HTCC2150]|nr:aminotransferase, class V [Rhodobacterales bacterium HTCC2150] [Rhodobacteraceae bacterium HTCC2150]
MKLDLEFTRAQFPAFAEPSLNGQAFFENAGGSYTCRHVYDRLTRFYRERKVQPYSAYPASTLGGQEMDEARAGLAAMMGVETDELSFGPSTTQNTYVLSQAFAQMMSPGDVVIVTNQDHEANSGPWRRLAERGMIVREWQMNEEGHLDPADLAELLDDKVKLVCFPHCSNVIGEVNDVAAITQVVHDAGAVCCVDGVSYAPHGIANVSELGADIYLFSAYKTYGPHQGIMAIRRDLGMRLPNQGHHFNADSLYKRFTPAGPDHAQVAASAGMVDYANALYDHHFNEAADLPSRAAAVHNLMRGQETELMQPLLDFLAAKNSVRLLGPTNAASRAPTLALDLGRAAQPFEAKLAKHGIMSGGGDFYAGRALMANGVDPELGALRVSFVHYTSPAEIQQLIDALDQEL